MRKKPFYMAIVVGIVSLLMVACGADDTAEPADAEQEEAAQDTVEEETVETEAGGEVTVQHDLGEAVIPKNPETVVVFDFGTLDSLDRLGVEVAGVPQANVPAYLSQYEEETYANVGTLFEPDFETIYDLQPDLIIISGRTSEAYDELSDIAPTLFVGLDTENYLESFRSNMETLGEIFGKETEVEEALANLEASIEEVQQLAAEKEETGLIVLANDGNVSAYGPGSRFGVLHDEFGVTPVDENIEVSNHGQSISFEYIVEKNPDHLFVIDRGAVVQEGEETNIENELVQQTTAYEEGNIHYLTPDYWYISGGGLVSVEQMIDEMKAALQ
ncbi:siderophore ABC transporter substrate-binding protein [Halalkalibacterium halodurans]|nr:siderophore ABC transporter substrate-binding protein [Halalkalibacterium halodurans]TPE70630.1 siderophore ABC transporter substrate-binding protein [Halalkalibacterium halodurans]